MSIISSVIVVTTLVASTMQNDWDCIKYFSLQKEPKGIGFTHMQDKIVLCRTDSVYTFTETLQRRKNNIVETVSEKIFTGKWSIKNDTLILYNSINDSPYIIFNKFIIKNKQLVFASHTAKYAQSMPRRKKYIFKLFTGSSNFLNKD